MDKCFKAYIQIPSIEEDCNCITNSKIYLKIDYPLNHLYFLYFQYRHLRKHLL